MKLDRLCDVYFRQSGPDSGLQPPVPEVVHHLQPRRIGGTAGEQGGRAWSKGARVTEEAWAELEEAMKEGEIASIAQAHAFLPRRGISCLGKGFRIVYCCPTAAKIPVA